MDYRLLGLLKEIEKRGVVRRWGNYWRFASGTDASASSRYASKLVELGYIEEIVPTDEMWGKARDYYEPGKYHFYAVSEAGHKVLEEAQR